MIEFTLILASGFFAGFAVGMWFTARIGTVTLVKRNG